MDEVNALQHDAAGEAPLTVLWKRISGRSGDFTVEEDLARRQILDRSFSSQRNGVVRAIYEILQTELATRDITWPALERCLTEILANFSVYRLYLRVESSSQSDREFLSRAVKGAKRSCLPADQWLVEELGTWLGGKRIRTEADTLQNTALTKFQQLSAPLCAKAVEDTAFYRYGRLISRNDVGFDPRRFSVSADEFHGRMRQRVAEFPHSLLTTATHDHKRGEDVRSRLAVLSELAADWAEALQQWVRLALSQDGTMQKARPDSGDLAILFQTIVGAWPMTLELNDTAGLAAYGKRIIAWQLKAVREAKLRSDWSAPNEVYENALTHFIQRLFSAPSELLAKVEQFARRIAPAGVVNGLAQLLLKLVAPGVPDIYQGTEYWDLSLVDPDNRAPVDFAARQGSMAAAAPLPELVANWRDGRIKQFVMARTLAMRKKIPELFTAGSYLPIEVNGAMAASIVAFARTQDGCSTIAVVCRSVASVLGEGTLKVPRACWQGTRLIMPPELRTTLFDVLAPRRSFAPQQEIEVASIFENLPIALLTSYSSLN
jgi:malto-oligosyltrehalose synthase